MIKIILICLLLLELLFVRHYRGTVQRASSRIILVLLIFFFAVAVFFPSLVNRFAKIIGVGRGTDLVLYLFITTSAGVIILLFKKFLLLERRIVDLNRALVIELQKNRQAD